MAKNIEVEIIEKLNQALRLLAVIAAQGHSQTDQIAMLSRIGLAPKDIADALGTTANTVRVALVSIRRAGKQKKQRTTVRREE